jgi:hypothetical protein
MMQNPDLSQMMSPGMMKNVDIVRGMSIGDIRGMSMDQMRKMSDEMMKNTPKEQIDSMRPKTEDMPGPECTNGVAACKDLDFSKMCQCGGCQVYLEHSLSRSKPNFY